MNRQIFINLTVAVIAIMAAFASCQKDDNDKVKLLETVTEPNGQYRKFEYDSQNRLTKYLRYNSSGELLETRTLTYSGNDLVKAEFNSATLHEYTKSGNKITAIHPGVGTQTWDLNSNGQLVKYVSEIFGDSQVIDFLFQNGNMVKETYVYNYEAGGTYTSINEYKYNADKSPMYNCTTPQWYLIYSFMDIMIGTKNNMTERKWSFDSDTGADTGAVTHEYEYDSDGYPTKRITTDGIGRKEVTDFTYKQL